MMILRSTAMAFMLQFWYATAFCAVFLGTGPLWAQTIRERTEQHLRTNLEKETDTESNPSPENAAPDATAEDRTQTPDATASPRTTTTDSAEPEPAKKALREDLGETIATFYHDPIEPVPRAQLPRRVIHRWFKLDPMAGIAYRGWIPQQYPSVETDIANYFTWMVALQGRFFNLISLRKGHYESNGLSSPRHPYKENIARYGNYGAKAAFFLAELGLPIMKSFEPVIRYETRAYQTTARAKNRIGVCIVDFDSTADAECTRYERTLTLKSAYETAVIGVTYYPSKNPSPVLEDYGVQKPSIFLGLGYLSYVKPYQVSINSEVLKELLFTGRFYGGGLAFGTNLGGGVNRPRLDIWTQFGLGAARLTRDMTLNDAAPNDWVIGYIQGNLTFTFPWAPFEFAPTVLIVPSIEASGATFFFMETRRQEGEDFRMPLINWDILYCARLSLVVTL
jgi:hypothetical protein